MKNRAMIRGLVWILGLVLMLGIPILTGCGDDDDDGGDETVAGETADTGDGDGAGDEATGTPADVAPADEAEEAEETTVLGDITLPTPLDVVLTAPRLLSPANGATVEGELAFPCLVANLRWQAVTGAARYGLIVNGRENSSPIEGTQREICREAGSITWQVYAMKATGERGPLSEVFRFTLRLPD